MELNSKHNNILSCMWIAILWDLQGHRNKVILGVKW